MEANLEWYFTAWRSPLTGRWTGLAKREPFVDGRPLHEPGDVWFEFGETKEEAMKAIKMSVLN